MLRYARGVAQCMHVIESIFTVFARASYVMTHTHDSAHGFCTIIIATLNGSGSPRMGRGPAHVTMYHAFRR